MRFPLNLTAFKKKMLYFLVVSFVFLLMYWETSTGNLSSVMYQYLTQEYLLFLVVFPKIPLLDFIFLTKHRTHFTEKQAPRLRVILFVLMLVSISLVFIGTTMQSFFIFKFAVLGGIASTGGLFLISQIYYTLKLSEKDVELDVRKLLVNSIAFYLPLQIWVWASFFGTTFIDYVIFPLIKPEYQTMLLGSLLGICLYAIFIEVPFWRGQKASRELRLADRNKKKETLLADLRLVSGTSKKQNLLKKISYQIELLTLENEIRKIESEPLHPYKGALAPLSILIGALLSPVVEWVLKILAI